MPVISMDFTARQQEFVIDVFHGPQRERHRVAVTAVSLMNAKRLACEMAYTLTDPVAVIIYRGASLVRSMRELPVAVMLAQDVADQCPRLSVA